MALQSCFKSTRKSYENEQEMLSEATQKKLKLIEKAFR